MILDEIKTLLKQNDNFYITSHINPDGDAVGSCFGLGLALQKLGKNVQVILDPFQSRFDIIPGGGLLSKKAFSGDIFLICLDCADISRLIPHCQKLTKSMASVVNIDHHYTNTNFGNLNYVDGNASSTCELVYRLLDNFVKLDKDIASALYAGMVSDTGGFRFNSTSSNTLMAAGKLVSCGIDFTAIYTELMLMRSYTEIKILAKVLESTQLSADGKIMHVCVDQNMIKSIPNALSRDVEGIVEMMLNTRGVEISVLLYEKENGEIKISFRSRNTNVGEVAKKFGGGGHHLAAGANAKGNIYEIREQVLSLL